MAREEANRRRKMLNEVSTSIDSTLTLIEVMLNKLELVRFDYRGLDDLKLELNLMQDLLRRAGFLRKSQSSVLFPFFERLRHFYFLLRKESEFEYGIVAEIARFREIIEGFRREFCEWNTSLLDSVLDELPAAEVEHDRRDLEVELKLLKMLYQCSINERYKEGSDFFKSDVKFGIDDNAKKLCYCLVKLKASGKGLNLELAESLSTCRKSLIANCVDTNVWVRDLYSSMSSFSIKAMFLSYVFWFSRDDDQVVYELQCESSELIALSGSRNAYHDYMMELVIRNLPDCLLPCLLYMAAFPEGRGISVKRLVWLLISEGIVWQNEMKDLKVAEDIAEGFITDLVKRNLVLVAEKGSLGKAKTCRINGFVRDHCLSISKEENFLQVAGNEHEFSNLDTPRFLKRLVICSGPQDFVKLRGFPSRLNSLKFHSKSSPSRSVSHSLSSHFRLKCLTVLDLEQINLGSIFPREITKLVELRFLAILGAMKAFPDSIINLSNLETLLLTACFDHGRMDFLLPSVLGYMHDRRLSSLIVKQEF